MPVRDRMKLRHRTLLVLCGVAALSTVLALVLQDRALSNDLQTVAAKRLDGAAEATALLVRNHVEAAYDRYRAVSGTPQFRATLEVDDAPTLEFYASQLAAREGAALVAFVGPDDRVTAASGDPALIAPALAARKLGLFSRDQSPYVVSAIPLRTREHLVGQLVAAEPILPDLVDQWSSLCGADVAFVPTRRSESGALAHVVYTLDDLELRVTATLDAERAALSHARLNLLIAGGIALALAFSVSARVSRSLVEPILEIKQATDRIGEGDFDARLGSARSDEIGDVARSVDGMLSRLVAYRKQVDEQRGALEENIGRLRESQEQLANAQRMAHIGSFQFDLTKGLVHGSDEFRAIFHFGHEERPYSAAELLERVHVDDRRDLAEAVVTCIRERLTLRSDVRIRLDDGQERVLYVQAKRRDDATGGEDPIEGTVQDVTERKRSEQQIRYLAYHDSLTGLGNRLHCRERVGIQIAQAARSNRSLGILYLDVDRFKRINDTLGHSLGDELLKVVADRLVASVRETDYIGRAQEANAVSRLGGDEFTVVVADLDDLQDLGKIARRILRAFEKGFMLGTHELVVSCSIGIAIYPNDGRDVDSLLTNADAAMYHAKETGRNNYQFYDESMNEVALRRLILENKMRAGLERREFELHYQPKVDLATDLTTGVEALVRWREPESGLVGPDVFIPIAEETGLIDPLGEWVLREACRQIAVWREQGIAKPVSVNLSAHQFRSGNLSERILGILDESRVPPELLEIEITESTLMHDERSVIADLERLRSAGVAISLDDFGTGYSSFAYLRRLPVDVLKIDRSFVDDIVHNGDDAALAASIVSMGRALGLKIIAEGVETRGQRDLLASWGCDEVQGYFYSPPLAADELEMRLVAEVAMASQA